MKTFNFPLQPSESPTTIKKKKKKANKPTQTGKPCDKSASSSLPALTSQQRGSGCTAPCEEHLPMARPGPPPLPAGPRGRRAGEAEERRRRGARRPRRPPGPTAATDGRGKGSAGSGARGGALRLRGGRRGGGQAGEGEQMLWGWFYLLLLLPAVA